VRAAPNRGEVGADRWAPATVPYFDRSKFDLSELQKFEIKYEFEDLEMVNNFLHRNFFRFISDLE
jgi:hypothetical protein